MTLLIFLLSVAVAESILRHVQAPRPDDKQVWARQFLARRPQADPATTPGLFALGRALETYGAGRSPAVPRSQAQISDGPTPEVRSSAPR